MLANRFEVVVLQGRYVAVGVPVDERRPQGAAAAVAQAVGLPAAIAGALDAASYGSAATIASVVGNALSAARLAISLGGGPAYTILGPGVSWLAQNGLWLLQRLGIALAREEVLRLYPWLASTYLLRAFAARFAPGAAIAAIGTAAAIRMWRTYRDSPEGRDATRAERDEQFYNILYAVLPAAAAGAAAYAIAGGGGGGDAASFPGAVVQDGGAGLPEALQTSISQFSDAVPGLAAPPGGAPPPGNDGDDGSGGGGGGALAVIADADALDALAGDAVVLARADGLLANVGVMPAALVRGWVQSMVLSGLYLASTGAFVATGGGGTGGVAAAVAGISMVVKAGTLSWARGMLFTGVARLALNDSIRALVAAGALQVASAVPLFGSAVALLTFVRDYVSAGGSAMPQSLALEGAGDAALVAVGGIASFWQSFWQAIAGIVGGMAASGSSGSGAGGVAVALRAPSTRAAAIAASRWLAQFYASGGR